MRLNINDDTLWVLDAALRVYSAHFLEPIERVPDDAHRALFIRTAETADTVRLDLAEQAQGQS